MENERLGNLPEPDPDFMEQLRKLARETEKQRAIKGNFYDPHPLRPYGTCPNCGYCPHCGRGRHLAGPPIWM